MDGATLTDRIINEIDALSGCFGTSSVLSCLHDSVQALQTIKKEPGSDAVFAQAKVAWEFIEAADALLQTTAEEMKHSLHSVLQKFHDFGVALEQFGELQAVKQDEPAQKGLRYLKALVDFVACFSDNLNLPLDQRNFGCLPRVVKGLEREVVEGFLSRESWPVVKDSATVIEFYQMVLENPGLAIRMIPSTREAHQRLLAIIARNAIRTDEMTAWDTGSQFAAVTQYSMADPKVGAVAAEMDTTAWDAGSKFAAIIQHVMEDPKVGAVVALTHSEDMKPDTFPRWIKETEDWKWFVAMSASREESLKVITGNLKDTFEEKFGLLNGTIHGFHGVLAKERKTFVEQSWWIKCTTGCAILLHLIAILFLYFNRKHILQLMGLQRHRKHKSPPSQNLDLNCFGLKIRPKDVFIAFSGDEQRFNGVAAMKKSFAGGNLETEERNLDSFVDVEMPNSVVGPRDTMRYHLETCRHFVVIVCSRFLQRNDPCDELVYAFERMQWIRLQPYRWQSLSVVLYGVSLSEYKAARKRNSRLPDLGNEVKLEEFPAKSVTWERLCNKLKEQIIAEDNQNGIQGWEEYLMQWPRVPRPSYVYSSE